MNGIRFAGPLLLAVALAAGAGCASVPPRDQPVHDRFEPVNRVAFRFDRMLDRRLIEPVARGYSKGDSEGLPGKTRKRVSNFFINLRGPVDITNNLLQGKFKRGFSGIGRLLVNSTIGLGGLFDPATRWGMPQYPEDFGQTLARWGVPHGPYIYVPLFGPRSARDLAGLVFDWQQNPITDIDDTATRNSIFALGVVDRRTDVFVMEYFFTIEDPDYETTRDEFARRRWSSIYYDGRPPIDFNPN